jgi:phage FluMu gp28-like protein
VTAPEILRPYQRRILDDWSPFREIVKSRRIGVTYALAAGAVVDALDGVSTYYSAQTDRDTREFAEYVHYWGDVIERATQRVVFASARARGIRVTKFARATVHTMTSNPRSIHGKQGHAICDEAARYSDLPGFLEAAKPLIMLGGRVTLCSTEAHTETLFHQIRLRLHKDPRPADLADWTLHEIFFDEAIAEGFFEHHVLPTSRVYTRPEEASVWAAKIRAALGDDAGSQLDGIPVGESEVYLSRDVLASRSSSRVPVLRYRAPPEAARWTDHERDVHLAPFLAELLALTTTHPTGPYVIGADYGRSGDISVITVLDTSVTPWRTRCVVELRNTPTAMQFDVWSTLFAVLGRVSAAYVDAGGIGREIANDLVRAYGSTIHAVTIGAGAARPASETGKASTLNYAEILPPLKSALVDRRVDLPDDGLVHGDLMGLRIVDGRPRVPSKRESTTDGQRHCDAAVAYALAVWAATKHRATSIGADFDPPGAPIRWRV